MRFVLIEVKVTIIDQKRCETWNWQIGGVGQLGSPPTIGTLQIDRPKVLTRTVRTVHIDSDQSPAIDGVRPEYM